MLKSPTHPSKAALEGRGVISPKAGEGRDKRGGTGSYRPREGSDPRTSSSERRDAQERQKTGHGGKGNKHEGSTANKARQHAGALTNTVWWNPLMPHIVLSITQVSTLPTIVTGPQVQKTFSPIADHSSPQSTAPETQAPLAPCPPGAQGAGGEETEAAGTLQTWASTPRGPFNQETRS